MTSIYQYWRNNTNKELRSWTSEIEWNHRTHGFTSIRSTCEYRCLRCSILSIACRLVRLRLNWLFLKCSPFETNTVRSTIDPSDCLNHFEFVYGRVASPMTTDETNAVLLVSTGTTLRRTPCARMLAVFVFLSIDSKSAFQMSHDET
jgi:hypothetical protein